MPRNKFIVILTIFFLTCVLPTFAQKTQKRLALVIGNGSYSAPNTLRNPSNDADDMAQALTELDFEVIRGINQNKQQTEKLIEDFGKKLAESKGVGLFYYAGIGFQLNGENFIVPVDADFTDETKTADSAVALEKVLAKFRASKNDLNIILLEPAHLAPFQSIWKNRPPDLKKTGFARVSMPKNTFVFYAAGTGQNATEKCGRNGYFAATFLRQLDKPKLEFSQLARNVSEEVTRKTNRRQQPLFERVMMKPFYLVNDKRSRKTGQIRSLEMMFASYRAERKCECGKRDEAFYLAKDIITIYGNDKDNKEVIEYIKKDVEKLEKEDPICSQNNRYNTSYKGKNWPEFFAVSKEIIAREGDTPLAFDVMLTLVSVGYNRTAVDKLEKYNGDTINYAKTALQKLVAGKSSTGKYGIYEPFKTSDNALSWMNYILGFYTERAAANDPSKKKEALVYFYKSTLLGTENKSDIVIYTKIGAWYFDEAVRLDKEYRDIRAANKNTENDAAKAKLALARGYAERGIDAMLRARQIAIRNKTSPKIIDAINKTLNDLYRFRFNIAPGIQPEGVEIYFEKFINKPMPNPETIVEPIFQ